MTTEPIGQPWGGGTYHGFSTASPALDSTPPRPVIWPVPRAAAIGGGVAIALVLGLGLGLAAKPDLGRSAAKAPMRAVVARDQQTMSIEVNSPPPTLPVPKAAGKLEVLPPDMAAAAPKVARAAPAPAFDRAPVVSESDDEDGPPPSRAPQPDEDPR